MNTELVGIVNVTPDSFSDGHAFLAPDDALARVQSCFEEGASVVDIGAQSTRPGATLLSAKEEWARLAPVLPEAVKIAQAQQGVVSVDTFHPEVAARALEAGAGWINDVTGFEHPDMVAAVQESSCRLVVMHSLGVPVSPALTLAKEADCGALLAEYFMQRIEALEDAGIPRERLILDPGLGFGKTAYQSLAIALHPAPLQALGLPVLIGHSRKSFLTLFANLPAPERDDLTLALSAHLAVQRIAYLRVHAVGRHAALLDGMDANMPHRRR